MEPLVLLHNGQRDVLIRGRYHDGIHPLIAGTTIRLPYEVEDDLNMIYEVLRTHVLGLCSKGLVGNWR